MILTHLVLFEFFTGAGGTPAGGVTYPMLERGIRGLERGVAMGTYR